jgi:hypothetical protein
MLASNRAVMKVTAFYGNSIPTMVAGLATDWQLIIPVPKGMLIGWEAGAEATPEKCTTS